MRYYSDVHVNDIPDIAPQIVMNMLFEKFHLILAEQKRDDVGVSFPAMNEDRVFLGKVLRIHGEKEVLEAVLAHRYFVNLRDYVSASTVREIPSSAGACVVSRVQPKSNPERLRRRRMKRHGISAEEAAKEIPDSAAELLLLPYIVLNSRSTGQKFRLYIRQRVVDGGFSGGSFGFYGLSPVFSVPWF